MVMPVPIGLREAVPLGPLSTLGVGGPARYFLHAEREDELENAFAWARSSGLSTLVIGGGSNLLVSDRGFDGLVVRVGIVGIRRFASEGDQVTLEVGAGEIFDDFVADSVRERLAGLECLSGIPGLVGATPMQNVGAYGQEVGDSIVAVRVMDRETGAVSALDRAACRFAYRSSIFKKELAGVRVVLSVAFALSPGPARPLRYAELEREVRSRGADPGSLQHVRDAVLSLRRTKSMVIDPADPNRRSAGSFFMNPVVDSADAGRIEAHAGAPMPRFPAEQGVKLSAAWLIERAGFNKGDGDGAVGLSTRHALAVVNRGGASALDILRFAARLRRAVRKRFGIALAPEPSLVGFDAAELALFDA